MIEPFNDYDKDFRNTIGTNIKRYRKEKNIRLMELAEMLEITPEYLKRIESPGIVKRIVH